MRPKYETKKDRDNEAAALAEACRRWEVNFITLPKLSCADAILSRYGEGKAIVDVKVRWNRFGEYDNYKVSLEKVDNIRLVGELTKLRPYLLVQFTDCLTHLDLLCANDIDPAWGRKDRNDPKDIEAAAVFDWAQFTKFRTK